MRNRKEILNRMHQIEQYFFNCSLTDKLFTPEFECAKSIREQFGLEEKLTREQSENILKIYNTANTELHYDGSGWFDYQLNLLHLLKLDGFDVKLENPTGRIHTVE